MAAVFDKLKSEGVKPASWYQAQIRKLGSRVNPRELISEGKKVGFVIPGFMYLFGYNPKFRNELPYYDIYPLVLPFRKTNEGFIGINLHYMPYPLRLRVLDTLKNFANNKNMDETTKVRFSYRLLENSAKLKPAKASVKKYLNEQLRTRFLKIPFPDWVVASQLPVQRFKKQKMEQVWKDTRRKSI
jgi:hypothetical protein